MSRFAIFDSLISRGPPPGVWSWVVVDTIHNLGRFKHNLFQTGWLVGKKGHLQPPPPHGQAHFS